jgi:O-antigen/teichoic acid export membrane protein
LAVYTSILSLIIVVSGLRLNIAIPLPVKDLEAINLVAVCLSSALCFAVATAIPALFLPEQTARLLGQPAMQPYLWLIPVGVIFATAYDSLQYWATRKKRYGLVTRTRMTRALGGAGVQVGTGIAASNPLGLIAGQVIYSGLGSVGLAYSMWKNDREMLRYISPRAMSDAARAYRKFPVYSVPEALFNAAGPEISLLIIAVIAPGPEVGFLMLAMRVLGLPMGLVGSSLAQVYLSEAPQKYRDGQLAAFTRRIMWALFKTGAPLLLLAGVAAPFAFPIVFGAEWARAGVIVMWLTPMFILQLVASPVSMVLHVTGRLSLAMWLQIAGGIFRILCLVVATYVAPAFLVEALALSGALFYASYIMCLIFASKDRNQDV